MIEPTGPFSLLPPFEERFPIKLCGCYALIKPGVGMYREQCEKHRREEIEKTRSN